jgi:hypothetical protein
LSGDDTKYLVARVGTIAFQLDSSNSLDFDDFLQVFPSLRNKFLSFSVMEDKVYIIEFKNKKVGVRTKKFSPDTTQVIGFREGNIYRL